MIQVLLLNEQKLRSTGSGGIKTRTFGGLAFDIHHDAEKSAKYDGLVTRILIFKEHDLDELFKDGLQYSTAIFLCTVCKVGILSNMAQWYHTILYVFLHDTSSFVLMTVASGCSARSYFMIRHPIRNSLAYGLKLRLSEGVELGAADSGS